MAGLQADINNEFLKSFIPETVYLLEEDMVLPSSASPAEGEPDQGAAAGETAATSPATVAAPAPVPPAPEAAPERKVAPALPKIPKMEAAPVQQKYKVIGQNRKGVVVLVTLPDANFVQLPQLTFLNKILGAIGLKPDDVAYVNNVSGELAQFEDLQQELQVNYIISFASRVETDLPHEKFTLYNPVTVGTVPVVFSQALSMLENNVEHKKHLWGALQKVFL
ncbi:hypothetical protein [Pontibacter actiniarum]|uniref:Uncharacterized protein n=1 Tax=Pontibacter actiniarum TaxID=323450 RepID=A0A1X9YQB8_9BACT|nr:hypothetical protein [Pontibacter actiniarum]ARS35052.1 hypothetical protein CA264_06120 [Pontibacter actiniarum]